ncbi:DUF2382 domain-containing protein [Thermocoleostomius sinensis]|jgi:very-short-patch-repair endonuclease|uniref:DUF2382 domain-containing protein n=1 Tax=Thermocoleostomius sinensis A174 TaxID=2016057 RepID=A0A9E8ZK58_9CYAN|nr:DUF2382 domain-containing protein [Thermocoleostomius sinensis]WAL62700.1 DUF2382 domain-containing protein [Thermocoleostomius sinensis A174]
MHDRHPDPIAPVNSASTSIEPLSHKQIQLLEERLRVNLRKRKVGEIVLRKEIETQIVEIPIRRERLIVEQVGSDHRQLASIDIGKTEFTEAEIAALIHQSDEELNSLPSTPAISVQVAHQLLTDVLSRPGYEQTNIRLSFEDPELQSIYQQWLERHLRPI